MACGNLVYALNWKTWWILDNRKFSPIFYNLQYTVRHLFITIGSRMAELNNIVKHFKVPPTLGKDTLYANWKKEIKILEAFTSVTGEKCSPAIFMTLTGEIREAILNMYIEKLTEKTGVNNLMVELDKMYLKDSKDESSQAYEACETFAKLLWPSGMSISDYLIKFE